MKCEQVNCNICKTWLTGISAAGGYEKMLDDYSTSEPDPEYTAYDRDNVSCSKVNQNFMHLVRPPTDDTMPWTGYHRKIMI